MELPDFLGFGSVPGLKPPHGQHWTWWVLWLVWAGFWLPVLAIGGWVAFAVVAG